MAKDQHEGGAKKPPACPIQIIVFTVNLLLGLVVSQVVPEWLGEKEYDAWRQVVKLATMFCLSYIMTNVGYEFDLDKSKLRSYGKEYGIAMTAAGFPWIFVAAWFALVLPEPLKWSEALIAARFAAPTSAGILFSMLEAAGMKETWLFQKARTLAIFDDLDTILLMVPLKVIVVGLKWELSIDLLFVFVLIGLAWHYMHQIKMPVSGFATCGYAAIVTTLCELTHYVTHYQIDGMDTVHLEVLLPAFTIGCIARSGHGKDRFDVDNKVIPIEPDAEPDNAESHEPAMARVNSTTRLKKGFAVARSKSVKLEQLALVNEEKFNTTVSAVFMVLVGLSMPSLFNDSGGGAHRRLGGEGSSHLPAGALVAHVLAVSWLMIVGKMFPTFCFRDEANLRTRLALSFGMCPRGEVGAGVIVISLGFGIGGSAITIAVISLAANLVMSSGFIMLVKILAQEDSKPDPPTLTPVQAWQDDKKPVGKPYALQKDPKPAAKNSVWEEEDIQTEVS